MPYNFSTGLSPHNVEQFVRYPETLDLEARRTVEKRLSCDTLARSTAEFYQGFYGELDALDGLASSKLEVFVDALFAPLPRHAGA